MDSNSTLTWRLSEKSRDLGWIIRWAVICGITALSSLIISDARPGQVVFWLANPVGAISLLRLQRKHWCRMIIAIIASIWTAKLIYEMVFDLGRVDIDGVLSMATGAGLEASVRMIEILLTASLLGRVESLSRAVESVSVHGMLLLRCALMPSVLAAPLGGMVWAIDHQGYWQLMALNWFTGSAIGTVAALPLALAVCVKHPKLAWKDVSDPQALFILLGGMAVVLWTGTSFPQPFVLMVVPVVLMAPRTNLVTTLTANFFMAGSMAALIRYGVLILPSTSTWWGDTLFYLSVLATLLPGLFLAVMSEGQRKTLAVLEANESNARVLYFQTPAILHSIDADNRIVRVSRLWLHTLGYREDEVIGSQVTDFMEPTAARHFKDVVIPASLREGRCDKIEFQMLKRDGTLCDVVLSAIWEYDSSQNPKICLAVLQDVSEKKYLEARSHYAEHDPLTGLPNRVILQDRLKMLCVHHARHGGTFAVGFLDLDHFKEVNDTYGHDAGDLLLRELASRLQKCLRSEDTVCRLGGDEFVMLFALANSSSELPILARKILQAVTGPFIIGTSTNACSVVVSASLGISVFPESGSEPALLLTHADQAMYAAKHGGRNRFEIYRVNIPNKGHRLV